MIRRVPYELFSVGSSEHSQSIAKDLQAECQRQQSLVMVGEAFFDETHVKDSFSLCTRVRIRTRGGIDAGRGSGNETGEENREYPCRPCLEGKWWHKPCYAWMVCASVSERQRFSLRCVYFGGGLYYCIFRYLYNMTWLYRIKEKSFRKTRAVPNSTGALRRAALHNKIATAVHYRTPHRLVIPLKQKSQAERPLQLHSRPIARHVAQ